MKKILFIACTTLLFACGNTEDSVVEVAETTEEVTITETMHGEEITDDGALTTVEFLEQFDSNILSGLILEHKLRHKLSLCI